MAQSLAERLQADLERQTAEIAAMTDSELKKLSAHVRTSVSAELNGIRIAIARSVSGMTEDLPRLKWIMTATWAALIVSLTLTGYSHWQSGRVLERAIAMIEAERDATIRMMDAKQEATTSLFAFDILRKGGWDYVIVPTERVSAVSCPDSVPVTEKTSCLRLPAPKREN